MKRNFLCKVIVQRKDQSCVLDFTDTTFLIIEVINPRKVKAFVHLVNKQSYMDSSATKIPYKAAFIYYTKKA